MNENAKLEGLVKTAMEKVHEMVDCETIVGKTNRYRLTEQLLFRFQRFLSALQPVARIFRLNLLKTSLAAVPEQV